MNESCTVVYDYKSFLLYRALFETHDRKEIDPRKEIDGCILLEAGKRCIAECIQG